MTDLYEALRRAMTPDGRVRLTRELLTAMHEEGERRSRMDDAMRSPTIADAIEAARRRGYAESDRDTLDAMGEPRDTPVHVALVRYREKFAALMRERAETAERERDNLLAVIHRDGGHHTGEHGVSQSVADAHATWAAVVRELAEMRADRDSWRQQCEDARSDALRYGRERDEAQRERDEANCERGDLRREVACARLERDKAIERARIATQADGGAGEAPIVLEPLAVESRVWAARRGHIEPGTISNVERAGPDGWRCSIYFDEGSSVLWYGPREVAPMSPECDPRRNEGDR